MLDFVLGRLLARKQLHEVQADFKKITPAEKAVLGAALDALAPGAQAALTTAVGDAEKAAAFLTIYTVGGKTATK